MDQDRDLFGNPLAPGRRDGRCDEAECARRKAQANDLAGELTAVAAGWGLELVIHQFEVGSKTFPHWMFYDARPGRKRVQVFQYWPTSRSWKVTRTGEKGAGLSPREALEEAERLLEALG